MLISEMEQKIEKSFFSFLVTCIWIGYGKFSLLQIKYLLCGVNVLTNNLKSSYIKNRYIFQHNFPQSDEKIW